MSEIRWQIGKDEYFREEVEHLLSTQRAMISNDVKLELIDQAEFWGFKGELTYDGKKIMKIIDNCRKPEY